MAGPTGLALCLGESGAWSRRVCFAASLERSERPGLPLVSYAVELVDALSPADGSIPVALRPLPIGARDLVLGDLGIVLTLPAAYRGPLPLYEGPPLNVETKGLSAQFDPRTGAIVLRVGDRRLLLKAYSWIELESRLRWGYPYEKTTFYRPAAKAAAATGGGLLPVAVRRIDLKGALFVYTITVDQILKREVFQVPGGKVRGTLYLPYRRRKQLAFRTVGLCLFPPALLSDVLTGIFQVLFYSERLQRSCLLR